MGFVVRRVGRDEFVELRDGPGGRLLARVGVKGRDGPLIGRVLLLIEAPKDVRIQPEPVVKPEKGERG